MIEPLYFGCWGGTGHHLRAPDGTMRDYYAERARCARPLDGGYPPQHPRPWRSEEESDQPEGRARLHHEGDRTILAFWDRTVDRRLGSHSTFLLPGHLDFAGAVAAARAAFPTIWARLDAAGVVVRPS